MLILKVPCTSEILASSLSHTVQEPKTELTINNWQYLQQQQTLEPKPLFG
jgi:hypothetical protein